MYKYIKCLYLFIKVRKSSQSIKLEIEKKVKEVFIKVPEYIKRSLKQIKTEFEKKVFTFISTFKTGFAFIKLSTFVV